MDHKLCWIVLHCLFYLCNICLGDGLKVKPPDARQVERIDFKPQEKTEKEALERVIFKPTDENKEMQFGSVVWFVRKEEHGKGANQTRNNSKVKDIVRLRGGNTYRKQNQSVDDEQNNLGTKQVAQSTQSKSIEQNNRDNEDFLIKQKKVALHRERDPKTAKHGTGGSPKRRKHKNGTQNRTGNKKGKQKIKGNTVKTRDENETRTITENKDRKIAEHTPNVKDEVNTKLADVLNNPNDEVDDDNANGTSKAVQKIKEIDNAENSKAIINTEPNTKPNEPDENKHMTDTEKQIVVENADLLGLLLEQSDPSLVKVLIDNSSPENLNVFLSHTNITMEELKDIIAY